MGGVLNTSDSYKLMLLSAGTFNAAHTTLAAASASYTEVANGNGYTTGGLLLTNVVTPTVTTNDSKFDADDAIWNATGSGIQAVAALLYDDTAPNDPPLIYINFDSTQFAPASTDFKIVWPAGGILSVTTP